MEQFDLKQLIEQYPEVLTDSTKLKAYIIDLYPQCKRGMVNILVAIQQCGIVSEMQASKNPSALDMSRWKKVLDDDYGFAGRTAETCLQMWCDVIESCQTKNTIVSVSPELQNSQKDWFEYDGTTLKCLKEQYRQYNGVIYIPYGVTSIGDYGFKNCTAITDVVIPKGATSIGEWAFWKCTSLKKVTIPDSIVTMGENAFRSCEQLTSITLPTNIKTISRGMFSGCARLESIMIPKGVTEICEGAFEKCVKLSHISIPEDVQVVGNYAFDNCSGLQMVVFGGRPKCASFGDGAFRSCTALKNFSMPDSLTSIGQMAFYFCSNLTHVVIPQNIEFIACTAFLGCSGLGEITVSPQNKKYHSMNNCLIETENKTLILGCKNSAVPGNGSVTCIGKAAFSWCTGLTGIFIPHCVTKIYSGAFEGCTHLENITVSEENVKYRNVMKTLIEINSKTLIWGCKDSIIPADGSVTNIGDGAFGGYTNITEIVIPDDVTKIGDYAFEWCTEFEKITIPSSVVSIGMCAFSGCRKLSKINYLSTRAKWEDIDKKIGWCHNTGSFIIHCIDGNFIKKALY